MSTNPSPVGFQGKRLQSTAQQLVKNVIDYFTKERNNGGPLLNVAAVKARASAALKLNKNTITLYSKMAAGGSLSTTTTAASTPASSGKRRRRKRPKPITDVDGSTTSAIRRLVYEQYATAGRTGTSRCTIDEIGRQICDRRDIEFHGSRSSLRRLLRSIGFHWTDNDGRRRTLVERADIAGARIGFLRTLRENREALQPRPVVYVDETSIVVEGSMRFVALNAGCESGWIPDSSLFVRAKSSDDDLLDGDDFGRWVTTHLAPNLPSNSIVVMDNAPCHCVQEDRAPTQTARKADIAAWLDRHGIGRPTDNPLKRELLALVDRNRYQVVRRYAVDELLARCGHSVLRLPLYHYDLNAMELAWTQVKSYYELNNGSSSVFGESKAREIWCEALDTVTAGCWAACVERVRHLEDEYWRNDRLIDEYDERVADEHGDLPRSLNEPLVIISVDDDDDGDTILESSYDGENTSDTEDD